MSLRYPGGGWLALEGKGYLVGWNRAFAENHPGMAAAGEIDDGGSGRAGGRTTIDDEGNLVAELVADAVGVGTLRIAGEVGRGRGDRESELSDDSAWDSSLGNADGDVAGVRCHAEGKLGAGLDDDRKWAGPELLCKAVKGGVEPACQFVGLRDLGDQQRQGLMAGAGFDLVDAVDGLEIDRVDGETVEGVGGQGYDVAAVEAVDDLPDQFGFRLVGMDAEGFGRQIVLLCQLFGHRGPEVAKKTANSHHSIPGGWAQGMARWW